MKFMCKTWFGISKFGKVCFSKFFWVKLFRVLKESLKSNFFKLKFTFGPNIKLFGPKIDLFGPKIEVFEPRDSKRTYKTINLWKKFRKSLQVILVKIWNYNICFDQNWTFLTKIQIWINKWTLDQHSNSKKFKIKLWTRILT